MSTMNFSAFLSKEEKELDQAYDKLKQIREQVNKRKGVRMESSKIAKGDATKAQTFHEGVTRAEEVRKAAADGILVFRKSEPPKDVFKQRPQSSKRKKNDDADNGHSEDTVQSEPQGEHSEAPSGEQSNINAQNSPDQMDDAGNSEKNSTSVGPVGLFNMNFRIPKKKPRVEAQESVSTISNAVPDSSETFSGEKTWDKSPDIVFSNTDGFGQSGRRSSVASPEANDSFGNSGFGNSGFGNDDSKSDGNSRWGGGGGGEEKVDEEEAEAVAVLDVRAGAMKEAVGGGFGRPNRDNEGGGLPSNDFSSGGGFGAASGNDGFSNSGFGNSGFGNDESKSDGNSRWGGGGGGEGRGGRGNRWNDGREGGRGGGRGGGGGGFGRPNRENEGGGGGGFGRPTRDNEGGGLPSNDFSGGGGFGQSDRRSSVTSPNSGDASGNDGFSNSGFGNSVFLSIWGDAFSFFKASETTIRNRTAVVGVVVKVVGAEAIGGMTAEKVDEEEAEVVVAVSDVRAGAMKEAAVAVLDVRTGKMKEAAVAVLDVQTGTMKVAVYRATTFRVEEGLEALPGMMASPTLVLEIPASETTIQNRTATVVGVVVAVVKVVGAEAIGGMTAEKVDEEEAEAVAVLDVRAGAMKEAVVAVLDVRTGTMKEAAYRATTFRVEEGLEPLPEMMVSPTLVSEIPDLETTSRNRTATVVGVVVAVVKVVGAEAIGGMTAEKVDEEEAEAVVVAVSDVRTGKMKEAAVAVLDVQPGTMKEAAYRATTFRVEEGSASRTVVRPSQVRIPATLPEMMAFPTPVSEIPGLETTSRNRTATVVGVVVVVVKVVGAEAIGGMTAEKVDEEVDEEEAEAVAEAVAVLDVRTGTMEEAADLQSNDLLVEADEMLTINRIKEMFNGIVSENTSR
ncbi:hypothetical protein GPALN_005312 [Globodera pallida]|nr:hypothetical protein GPALN_005312 [Globodera pallida]